MKVEDYKFESDILALMPEKLNDVIATRQSMAIKAADMVEISNRRATRFKNVKGKVVVVPLNGYISHKATIWSALGFETSSQTFGGWIRDLVANRDVGAIVIDVDSPGGTVAGLTSVTDKIFAMRGTKPIIAVVNNMMASAAYFIGSAADEIVADPDSISGSIGTIAVHLDWSGLMEQAGVKATIIKAGKYKDEGHPYQPLTDEAKEDYQNMVNDYYDTFVSAVARNRGVTATKVKQDFGQGRVFRADKAVSVGMVDRKATLEQVIADLMPKGNSKAFSQAKLDLLKMR